MHQHRIAHRCAGRTVRLQHRQEGAERRGAQRHAYRDIGIHLARETGDQRRAQHAQAKTHTPGHQRGRALAATQGGNVNLKARNEEKHTQAQLLQQGDAALGTGQM